MIKIELYKNSNKNNWDDFVANSKNGTFLFFRDYMQYHQDRFQDFSLMIYENDKLIALLPANIMDDVCYSHMGLTYGGLVTDMKMKAPRMLNIFIAMKDFLAQNKIIKLVYKVIPAIFHKYPAEEDLYALFSNDAILIRRDISSTILQSENIAFERARKRQITKAVSSNLAIKETNDYESFFAIVSELLDEKYNVKPVHNASEMQILSKRFPDNIKLFGCYDGKQMISGSVIYITENVVHAQYIFSSKHGKLIGANDFMNNFLIKEKYNDKKYFNFGISTTNNGRSLNQDLIAQKEMFGSRAICFDWYELNIS